MEQLKSKPFEPVGLNDKRYQEAQDYIKTSSEADQNTRLKNLFESIHGFESPLSLEILASIDFILSEKANFPADGILIKIRP